MSVVYTEMKDRVAVITGGGGGIGRKVAQKLGQSGVKAFVVDAFQEPVDKALAELKELGVEATGYVVDVRDEKAVQEMVDTCMKTYGHVVTSSAARASIRTAWWRTCPSSLAADRRHQPCRRSFACRGQKRCSRRASGVSCFSLRD